MTFEDFYAGLWSGTARYEGHRPGLPGRRCHPLSDRVNDMRDDGISDGVIMRTIGCGRALLMRSRFESN